MEVTHSGVTGGGLLVANHAEEEFRNALVNATIPLLKTVEETVADWGELHKQGGVTRINVQVKVLLVKK